MHNKKRLFTYKVKLINGQMVKGKILCESSQVLKSLFNNNIGILLKLSDITWITQLGYKIKISDEQLLLFFQDLAKICQAGVTLLDALVALEQSNYLHNSLLAIIFAIRSGKLLSESLQEYSFVNNPILIACLRNGEQHGNYPVEFENISNYLKQKISFKQKIYNNLAYPCFLLIFSICLIFFLLSYVVPQVCSLYSLTDNITPYSTLLLIKISKYCPIFITVFGFIVVLLWLVLVVINKFCFAWPTINNFIRNLLLNIPLAGKILKQMVLLQYFSNIASLSKAAQNSIVNNMQMSTEYIVPKIFRVLFYKIQCEVSQGYALSTSLLKTQMIAPVIFNMLKSAEKTGDLSEILDKIVDYLSYDFNKYLNKLVKQLGIVSLLAVGSILAFIIISVFIPIYSSITVI